jgi:hypothetical protein
MAEEIKFTDEEITQINQLRQGFASIFVELGELTIERKKKIQEFDNIEFQIQQRHDELLQSEDILFKSLNEKYGDGNYDPNTGIFTPIEKN